MSEDRGTPTETHVLDILRNIVLACDANGLRGLPFVKDARQIIENGITEKGFMRHIAVSEIAATGPSPEMREVGND